MFQYLLFVSFTTFVIGEHLTAPVFIEEPPRHLTFMNTDGGRVKCRAEGFPSPEINWLQFDDKDVHNVSYVREIMADGTLVFFPFIIKNFNDNIHRQMYTCIAKNAVGSVRSKTVYVRAELDYSEYPPKSPAIDVRAVTVNEDTVIIFWKPPPETDWNAVALGYYIGKKIKSSDERFTYEIFDLTREDGKEHHMVIKNLQPCTTYSLNVEVFNNFTFGPTSDTVEVTTSARDLEICNLTCSTTSQGIQVSWNPLASVESYKIVFTEINSWDDEVATHVLKIKDSSITLNELKIYTRYKIQVVAYTPDTDRAPTNTFYCQTKEDIPGPPAEIKILTASINSAIISWKHPVHSNGIITGYVVNLRNLKKSNSSIEKFTLADDGNDNTYFLAKNLDANSQYKCWVSAFTEAGEGLPSKISFSLNSEVPARIIPFDKSLTYNHKEDVTLSCFNVGIPRSKIIWKFNGIDIINPNLSTNDTLLLQSISISDAGEYSCYAKNEFGEDVVTYKLQVKSPPLPPKVVIVASSSNTILFKIFKNPDEKNLVDDYIIHFKPQHGDWERLISKNVDQDYYTLYDLLCGTLYFVTVAARNGDGTSEFSTDSVKTLGSKPVLMDAKDLIDVYSTSASLQFNSWPETECRPHFFIVKIKKQFATEWTIISNNVMPNAEFIIADLEPATWYHLQVKAYNNAGFNSAIYEFGTLNNEEELVFTNKDGSQKMFTTKTPESPIHLSLDEYLSQGVEISWSIPSKGEVVERFLVSYKQQELDWESNTEQLIIPGDEQKVTISLLKPGTTYEWYVMAENNVGSSDPSGIRTFRT